MVTGMTMREYELDDPFNHEWTEKALDAIKAGTLHRRLIVHGGKVLAARVDGDCPRCEHPLRPFSLPLIGVLSEGGVLGRKASLAGSTYRIDVQCGCKHTHPRAPRDVTGCGIWFQVELKVGRDD
ncbi:MAG: hypothetical protein QM619_08830 [Micropruina sp.]